MFPPFLPLDLCTPFPFCPPPPCRGVRSSLRLFSFVASRCSVPRLGDSCLNAQTKRQIKGTAGRARTAREWVKGEKGRKRESERRRTKGVDNIYYYHRTRPCGPSSPSFLQHLAQSRLTFVQTEPSSRYRSARTRRSTRARVTEVDRGIFAGSYSFLITCA